MLCCACNVYPVGRTLIVGGDYYHGIIIVGGNVSLGVVGILGDCHRVTTIGCYRLSYLLSSPYAVSPFWRGFSPFCRVFFDILIDIVKEIAVRPLQLAVDGSRIKDFRPTENLGAPLAPHVIANPPGPLCPVPPGRRGGSRPGSATNGAPGQRAVADTCLWRTPRTLLILRSVSQSRSSPTMASSSLTSS